jgi:hypothetical protein
MYRCWFKVPILPPLTPYTLQLYRILPHAPFTSFAVTFCHIIAKPTVANADLYLLSDFVATLQSFGHMSDGIDKLYRRCDIFQRVADLYVKAKVYQIMNPSQYNMTTYHFNFVCPFD